MNLGAGNSSKDKLIELIALGLSEEMYDEGYQNITNIDISKVVTKAMQEKYKDKEDSFKCNNLFVL